MRRIDQIIVHCTQHPPDVKQVLTKFDVGIWNAGFLTLDITLSLVLTGALKTGDQLKKLVPIVTEKIDIQLA